MKAAGAAVGMTMYKSLLPSLSRGCDGGTILDEEGVTLDGDDIMVDGDDIVVDGDDIIVDGNDIMVDGNDITMDDEGETEDNGIKVVVLNITDVNEDDIILLALATFTFAEDTKDFNFPQLRSDTLNTYNYNRKYTFKSICTSACTQ